MGTLSPAIVEAAQEVADGLHDDQFVVDIFQTGSGTSTNMNANEVIANRAIETLGGVIGSGSPVHPNDHVNIGQSSNDVIPTAIHISALHSIRGNLVPALAALQSELESRAEEFMPVIKTGRTHLQDATPIRLGQEFQGYAGQVERGIQRLEHAESQLSEVALGGTAVGTGVNTHPEFAERVCARLSSLIGRPCRRDREPLPGPEQPRRGRGGQRHAQDHRRESHEGVQRHPVAGFGPPRRNRGDRPAGGPAREAPSCPGRSTP